MRGLIGYEESQEVANAFRKAGHSFYSCDMLECSGGHPEYHLHGNIHEFIKNKKFDFIGLHPVCKKLANSGVRWLSSVSKKEGFMFSKHYRIYINDTRYDEMKSAALEFKKCLRYVNECGRGYVENPIMHKYAMEIIGVKPTQIIQPYMFGHTTQKATCLWISGLPNLFPTKIIPKEKRTQDIWLCPPGPNRDKIRSKTFPLIAKAMADQWG